MQTLSLLHEVGYDFAYIFAYSQRQVRPGWDWVAPRGVGWGVADSHLWQMCPNISRRGIYPLS